MCQEVGKGFFCARMTSKAKTSCHPKKIYKGGGFTLSRLKQSKLYSNCRVKYQTGVEESSQQCHTKSHRNILKGTHLIQCIFSRKKVHGNKQVNNTQLKAVGCERSSPRRQFRNKMNPPFGYPDLRKSTQITNFTPGCGSLLMPAQTFLLTSSTLPRATPCG